MNDRMTVDRSGIGFHEGHAAFYARQCQIPDNLQLPIPHAENALGVERQQGAIGRVRNVTIWQSALRTECVPPLLIRRLNTEIEDRVAQIACVNLHVPGHTHHACVRGVRICRRTLIQPRTGISGI